MSEQPNPWRELDDEPPPDLSCQGTSSKGPGKGKTQDSDQRGASRCERDDAFRQGGVDLGIATGAPEDL
eukprot:3226888-Pyramimonas_sp.AAC.1